MIASALRLRLLGPLLIGAWTCQAVAADAGPARSKIDAAIEQGVDWLRVQGRKASGGQQSLAALAVLKAGTSADDPLVKASVAQIRAKIKNGTYSTGADHERIYSAGVEMMVLANIDAGDFKAEMQAIVKYILGQQHADGFWDYRPPRKQVGDTSMTQYALLGLWAAKRSGLDVPPRAFEQAARWLLKNQHREGGFTYRPGSDDNPESNGPTLTMTAAGGGNLLIVKRNLYPADKGATKKPTLKFGVLKKVEVDKTEEERAAERKKAGGYKPAIPAAVLEAAAQRALGWTSPRFGWERVDQYRYYHFYAVERFCALANVETIGTLDWYPSGAAWLLKHQKADGSWQGSTGDVPCTAFAVLFLTRATAKAIGNDPALLDRGDMIGGKGFDLEKPPTVVGSDGTLRSRTSTGPLDELLAMLENTPSINVEDIPQQIVVPFQIGEREDLLKNGKVARFVKWADHPDPEVRRTGIWVLGRTGDVKHVTTIFKALQSDPDADVAIEAHNALCWISRKPLGVGIPNSPYEALDASATKAQRAAAIGKWRAESVKRWKQWYLKARPYAERGDLDELKTREDAILNRKQ